MSFSPSASASSASASREVVFHCEHAPSGRAKCRVCLNSIAEGSLRLAVSVPSAEPSIPDPQNVNITRQRRIAAEAPQWCHANCFRKFRASAKWWGTHVDTAARWIGFSELSPPEQAQVRRFVTACEKGENPPHFTTDEEPEKSSDTADSRKHQRKSRGSEARMTKKEEKDESRSRRKERSHLRLKGQLPRSAAGSGGQSRKRSRVTSEKEGDIAKVPSRRTQEDESADGNAESEPRQPINAGGKKKKGTNEEAEEVAEKESVGQESIGLALTARQRQDIEEQLGKAEKEKVATLRSLLRMNNQKSSGPKEELAHRVAECRVLGAVPKCPQCRMGFLRFDGNKGEYRCPGFVNEDGEYERCSFKSTDVKRLPWKE